MQKIANLKFHYGAKETLDAQQALYDQGFTTYSRSDNRYITENEFKYLKENWRHYADFLKIQLSESDLSARKRYVNAEKVG